MPHDIHDHKDGADFPRPARPPVTQSVLEARLAAVLTEAPADPAAGLFGPDSLLWRIDREAALFLGAARALLLQLAHPWVAAGVGRHSVALRDPLGRFHRTFGSVYAMVFGTTDQAVAAARRLHRRHGAVTGTLPDGTAYRANQPEALAWVHATLVDSALAVHDSVLTPLTPDERGLHWAESRRMAGLFGLGPEDLPADWDGFHRDFAARLHGPEIQVTAEAARVARAILFEGPAWTRLPGWSLNLTAHWLPQRLAAGFGLPPADPVRAARTLDRVRRLLPLLPSGLRHVGPWHEATGRLAGRLSPGPGTALLNRIWIGRSRL